MPPSRSRSKGKVKVLCHGQDTQTHTHIYTDRAKILHPPKSKIVGALKEIYIKACGWLNAAL